MGQQQLLLITLGVIIVGVAVITGLMVFDQAATENKKNQIQIECVTLASMAQQFWRVPSARGGGGNSFIGFTIPPTLDTTDSGIYTIKSVANDLITISGVDRMLQLGQDTIKVVIETTPNNFTITDDN
ncbi:MAG: hypothetical protein J0L60_00070 [Ignavibacteria bacterium]|nr:hypothetical protein [Ignavibacteria bacterium]